MYVCTCMYVCIYVCMYVCMYVYTYVCMCVCLSVCLYTYTYTYIYTHIYRPLTPSRRCCGYRRRVSYADVCWRMLTYALCIHRPLTPSHRCCGYRRRMSRSSREALTERTCTSVSRRSSCRCAAEHTSAHVSVCIHTLTARIPSEQLQVAAVYEALSY
jgi:hypothetical protein